MGPTGLNRARRYISTQLARRQHHAAGRRRRPARFGRASRNAAPAAGAKSAAYDCLARLSSFLHRRHRRRRLVIDAMKGVIGRSQNALMRGRDWLTNTEREDEEAKADKKKRKSKRRPSLYGRASVEEIRADYAKYAKCLGARKNVYLANVYELNSLINFVYLDSYEAQQLPCTAWFGRRFLPLLLVNTRSPEAPAAADIHRHGAPRPASASVCTAGTWARPPICVSAVAQR